jgi:hypothetical protein
VRGLPVARSIFHDLEESLLAELGTPSPLDGATLTRTARRLLGAETAADATPPAGEPRSEDTQVLRF